MEIKIVGESLPERCEVCHKADRFDPVNNHCLRCAGVEEVFQEQPANAIPFPQATANPIPNRTASRTVTLGNTTIEIVSPEEYARRMLHDPRFVYQMLDGTVRMEGWTSALNRPANTFSANAPTPPETSRLAAVLLAIVLAFPVTYAAYILCCVFSAPTPAQTQAATVATSRQPAEAKKAPSPKVNLPKPEKPKPVDPDQIYSMGKDGVSSPGIIKKYKPHHCGVDGKVVLSVLFKKDGTVKALGVKESLGSASDQECIRVAELMECVPGKKDGVPVNVRGRLEFTFSHL